MKTQLTGQLTDEALAELKTKYKEVFQLKIETHIGYLKKPDRKTVAYAMTQMNNGSNPLGYIETLLNECWIGGSEAIKEEDDLFLAAIPVIKDLVQVKNAELVKL